MTSDSLPHTPPREPGGIASAILAVLMHALLFGALWFGIHWVSESPQSIDPDYVFTQQELNTPVPDPVPVPTPKVEDQTPPVPDPDIATAQEKKRLKEEKDREEAAKQKKIEEQRKEDELDKQKEKQEAEKKKEDDKKKLDDQKKLDEKKQQQEEQKRIEKARADEKARILKEAGGNPGASAPTTPGKPGAGSGAWVGKVQAKIKSLIIFNPGPGADPNATAQFDVSLLPDGSVASVRLTKSSGISAWDDAVKRAIEAAAPYPADTSSGTVPRQFTSSNRLGDKQ